MLVCRAICCQRGVGYRKWGKQWESSMHPQSSHCLIIPDSFLITKSCLHLADSAAAVTAALGPPSARCSPCNSVGHSASWHGIWVIYKKRAKDSTQNSIPECVIASVPDTEITLSETAVILVPYIYFLTLPDVQCN